LRIVSPITYLLRLAWESPIGFFLVSPEECESESLSARSTPVSAPGRMATTDQGRASIAARTSARAASASGFVSSCWIVASNWQDESDATRPATGEFFSARMRMTW